MTTRSILRKTPASLIIAGMLAAAFPAMPAPTEIADEPLSQAASGVQPNVMFILDASGSMDWDYSPDYVDDGQGSGSTPSTTAGCFDSGDDDSGSILGTPDACRVGDPPYMSPDYNKQYYNPNIWYRPGVNADGTDMPSMNRATTSDWTKVETDPYGQQQENQRGNNTVDEDLTTEYPDRAWCTDDDDDLSDTDKCRTNSAYTYPDHEFKRTSDDGRHRFGAPYYYRMQTAQWCTSAALTSCASGTSVDPNKHLFIAPEFCTDAELTNCAVGPAITAAHVFSGPRWCSDKTTLLQCQRKKIGNFRWPKHLGVTETRSVTLPATPARGTITVNEAAAGVAVTDIKVGSVSVIDTGTPIASSSTSTTDLATAIAAAINSRVSSPDYTAVAAGNVVTVIAVTTGTGENGKNITVASTTEGTLGAQAFIDVNSSNNNNNVYVDAIRADIPGKGWTNIMSTSCAGDWGAGVSAVGGGAYGQRILATNGTDQSNERTAMAAAIAECIEQAKPSTGFSATSAGDLVTVTAPVALGSLMNNRGISVLKGSSRGNYRTVDFADGESASIQTATSGTTGGTSATNSTIDVRLGVGYFTRVDIVPGNDAYPKGAGRIDCAGPSCTYEEEMTNFSNWYAYYRTRLQMMKSAAGRAFVPVDTTYRVGFITIKPFSDPVSQNSGDVVAARYLKIAEFDATHKAAWYTKFYSQTPGGGTPLREALSRVGRLYGGKFDGINSGIPADDDPVTVSCQPNFAILSSDGYWNGNGGKTLTGDMTQQDHVNEGPYSAQKDGVFDGGNDSTVGLADVALYYYQTDLRADGATNAFTGTDVSADNVPRTDLDFAAHQHMTTFTLGLGLDGQLSFPGDFAGITTGNPDWPNPQGDTPSALDDLWHAAVNGRGLFFSASNPSELARSLSETLDALKKRVGAGAAAATSNLRPVNGDNFAYTAQYVTQEWVGDVKARTIDLKTGAISSAEVWSAQQQLNNRLYTDRLIFTLDPTDAYDSKSTAALGNQLKHFCMPASVGVSPWCDDGAGLTVAEQAYFRTDQLPQYVSWTDPQKANATAENLVNYLRGHQVFEDQGNLSAEDLFRARTALLGDIINAQPAYVKSSPFEYNDAGYIDFRECTFGRTPTGGCPAEQFPTTGQRRQGMVYIASNDGMLHGLNADTGAEMWAYIPGIVTPSLYQLASIPYNHRYFVDGSPTVGDICVDACADVADWRTILVAGLNSGGRGFYALDVTRPDKPRALWEFTVRKPSVEACAATVDDAVGATTDCDLGLSYGNPVITKLPSGEWVVIVTSGLNNTGYEPGTTNRQGDGMGYLYVLDAQSGKILHKIATNVGDPGTAANDYDDADPSGLARINNWVDDSLRDNTALAVYGGDMKGNLWRFSLDPVADKAVLVAELRNASNEAQPITTRPELGLIKTRRVIFVGTGRFLGETDKTDETVQTVYAIADDLASDVPVTDRTPLVGQTMIANSSTTRTIDPVLDVKWEDPAVRGWYVDLPDLRERVSVDPQLQLGTLVVPSNVPSTDSCVAGGIGWVNTFDFATGGFVQGATANAVSQKISASVVVGINVIQLPGGKVVTIVTTADNQQMPVETPVAPTEFQGRRVSWRELIAD